MSKLSGTRVKDKIFNNFVIKIASVILAVILWLLVINIDDPQVTSTIKDVPVTILNEDVITGNDEVYDVLSGGTITIKVTGPRTIVDALKASDFTATADFKDLSKTDAVPIDVVLNNSRYESKVVISQKSENAMRLSIEPVVEKEYAVTVESNNNVQEDYVVYSMNPDVDTITVRAPESVHGIISKVAAILTFSGQETSDFEYAGSITLYDNNNNPIDLDSRHVTLSASYIKVSGTVYYKKTVDIKYTVIDSLSDEMVLTKYNGSMSQVDIVGRKSVLDQITEIDVPRELTVVTDDKTEIEVDLQSILPEGAFIYSEDSILKISAETEGTVRKTITIKVKDIGMRKVPNGYGGSIINEGTIDVVIMGPSAELAEIDAENLAPYVDLTGALKGDNIVNVNVVLPDGVTLVSEISVTVTLTETGEETSETDTTTPEANTTDESKTTEDGSNGENGGTQDETTTPAGEGESIKQE